jgi:hypothetical protein
MGLYFTPLNGKTFATVEPHMAPHHYLHVVPTRFVYNSWGIAKSASGYQLNAQNRKTHFSFDDYIKAPDARFIWDFTPTLVTYSVGGRKWYDFITSLMAIVGGVFTFVMLCDEVIYKTMKKPESNTKLCLRSYEDAGQLRLQDWLHLRPAPGED